MSAKQSRLGEQLRQFLLLGQNDLVFTRFGLDLLNEIFGGGKAEYDFFHGATAGAAKNKESIKVDALEHYRRNIQARQFRVWGFYGRDCKILAFQNLGQCCSIDIRSLSC